MFPRIAKTAVRCVHSRPDAGTSIARIVVGHARSAVFQPAAEYLSIAGCD